MRTHLSAHKYTIIAIAVSVLLAGCSLFPSRTASPLDGRKVTRTELTNDATTSAGKFAAGFDDLDRQDAIKAFIGKAVINAVAPVVPPNLFDLFTGAAALAAVGATTDNVLVRSKKKEAV